MPKGLSAHGRPLACHELGSGPHLAILVSARELAWRGRPGLDRGRSEVRHVCWRHHLIIVFHLRGPVREGSFNLGEWHDLLVYGLLRRELRDGRAPTPTNP